MIKKISKILFVVEILENIEVILKIVSISSDISSFLFIM